MKTQLDTIFGWMSSYPLYEHFVMLAVALLVAWPSAVIKINDPSQGAIKSNWKIVSIFAVGAVLVWVRYLIISANFTTAITEVAYYVIASVVLYGVTIVLVVISMTLWVFSKDISNRSIAIILTIAAGLSWLYGIGTFFGIPHFIGNFATILIYVLPGIFFLLELLNSGENYIDTLAKNKWLFISVFLGMVALVQLGFLWSILVPFWIFLSINCILVCLMAYDIWYQEKVENEYEPDFG